MGNPAVYEGEEPYVFISYAHKNTPQVLEIIRQLERKGYRNWYDAGIEAGTEWPEYIAQRLAGCGCFVAFITQEFLESQNCRREIHYAISKDLPMLAVYLEDVTLSPGMEMQLGTLQALYYQRHENEKSFVDALCEASVLKPCRPNLFNKPRKPPIQLDFKLDPLFVESVNLALDLGGISAAVIQRRFGLSFNRAAKILEQMEKLEIIGPMEGSISRTVLIDREGWTELRIRMICI